MRNSGYLVLHVRPYDFETEEGQRRQGSTVTYLDLSNDGVDAAERGFAPLNLSVDTEIDRQLTAVPGVYDLEFRQRRGRNGKPTIVLAGAKLRQPVEFVKRAQ